MSQFFFIYFAPQHMYIHTHTYLTSYRLYMNYSCYQITLQWNIFTQIWSGAKCWPDIYRWGVGLAVTGQIRDIGQKVLESSFQTGSSTQRIFLRSPYFQQRTNPAPSLVQIPIERLLCLKQTRTARQHRAKLRTVMGEKVQSSGQSLYPSSPPPFF